MHYRVPPGHAWGRRGVPALLCPSPSRHPCLVIGGTSITPTPYCLQRRRLPMTDAYLSGSPLCYGVQSDTHSCSWCKQSHMAGWRSYKTRWDAALSGEDHATSQRRRPRRALLAVKPSHSFALALLFDDILRDCSSKNLCTGAGEPFQNVAWSGGSCLAGLSAWVKKRSPDHIRSCFIDSNAGWAETDSERLLGSRMEAEPRSTSVCGLAGRHWRFRDATR